MRSTAHTGPVPVTFPCRSTGTGPFLPSAAIPILAAADADTNLILAVAVGLLGVLFVWHYLVGSGRKRRSGQEDDALTRRAFGAPAAREDVDEGSWLRHMQEIDPVWVRNRLGHPRERGDRAGSGEQAKSSGDGSPRRRSRLSIRR
jgi:hypothetical protein